jgi:hypothetical protein
MIKLDYIIHADKFAPAREHWKIDDIKVRITRYDGYAVLSIKSTTGDIADQVYYKIQPLEYFSDLKLGGISNYTIDVPLEKSEKFLQYIEKIDTTQLNEGKRY